MQTFSIMTLAWNHTPYMSKKDLVERTDAFTKGVMELPGFRVQIDGAKCVLIVSPACACCTHGQEFVESAKFLRTQGFMGRLIAIPGACNYNLRNNQEELERYGVEVIQADGPITGSDFVESVIALIN